MAFGVVREMFRGDTLSFQFQVFQSPPFNTIPQNLSGWTLWLTVKRYTQDPDNAAVFQGTTSTGAVVVNNFAQGLATATMPPLATRGFPDGVVNLVYDVQASDPANNVYTVEAGTIQVSPDVTNAIAAAAIPPAQASTSSTSAVINAGVPYNVQATDGLIQVPLNNGACAANLPGSAANPVQPVLNKEFWFANTSTNATNSLTLNAAPLLVTNFSAPGTFVGSTTIVLGSGGLVGVKWSGSAWVQIG